MKFTLFTLWLSATLVVAFDYSPKEIRAMEEGLRRWQELADHPETIPAEERIAKLGDGLRKTAQDNIYVFGDRQTVNAALRKTLLDIPGHANFYAARIHAAQEALDDAQGPSERGPRMTDLQNEQMDGFAILALLPSPETVRVLGEFLFDEECRVSPSPPGSKDASNKRQRESGLSPNSAYALQAIAKLPLVSPPIKKRPRDFVVYDDDINAWRLWYEQIKAGTRTFRFEGNPQEYSLAGPVEEASVPKDRRTDRTSHTPADSHGVAAENSATKTGILVAACALLATALWYGTRKKAKQGA